MSEFVTISLENNECEICHHDNGEELISYILNDRCLRQQDIWNRQTSSDEQVRKAHPLCLDRWDHIMRKSLNRLSPLRRSWSCGKQNSSLTKTNSGSHENLIVSRTWTEIKDDSHKQLTSNSNNGEAQALSCSRSTLPVDSTTTITADDKHSSQPLPRRDVSKHVCHKEVNRTLQDFSNKQLRENILDYNSKVRDVSAELIALLQERDILHQEIEVRRVAIEQLLKLQTGNNNRSQSVVKNTDLDIKHRMFLHV